MLKYLFKISKRYFTVLELYPWPWHDVCLIRVYRQIYICMECSADIHRRVGWPMLCWCTEMRKLLPSMLQCVGHKWSNVPRREGMCVPQHCAAVGAGHLSMPFATYTNSPCVVKTQNDLTGLHVQHIGIRVLIQFLRHITCWCETQLSSTNIRFQLTLTPVTSSEKKWFILKNKT